MENNTKIAKEKLMILYIIKKSNFTLNFNQLTNLILEFDFLNYFTFMQYFKELSNSSFFEKWDKQEIKLTDFAIQVLELLENTIDDNIKLKIDDIFLENSKFELNTNARLIPTSSGKCVVNLSLNQNEESDFSINFTVDSLESGEKIEKAWKNDSKNFYKKLMNAINDAAQI